MVFVEESGRERIGAGVTVYADIPYSTLGDDSSLDGDKHFETQTDGNGLFSLELPVGNGKTTLPGIIIKTQQVSLEMNLDIMKQLFQVLFKYQRG